MAKIIQFQEHALSSKGYRSGRSSCRGTPEARSTSSTRSGGTSTHCATACLVMFKEAASLVRPPANLMARSSGVSDVSDMVEMSSTASRQSQDPLHLHRQAALYAVDMTLGTKIRRARTARKMSLEKLGKALGVSRQLVWQWERDRSDPRTHIEGLSQALEMPVEYFYGPTPPDGPLDAKMKRLSPAQQDLIKTMIDTMLGQLDDDSSSTVKRA